MAFPTHVVAAAGYVFDKEGNIHLGAQGKGVGLHQFKILNFNGKVTYASYVSRPEFQVLTERQFNSLYNS